jgi:hypothetical protein
MPTTADYPPEVGGSKATQADELMKGNDHHDHARESRHTWG